jgi:hypothetical protein
MLSTNLFMWHNLFMGQVNSYAGNRVSKLGRHPTCSHAQDEAFSDCLKIYALLIRLYALLADQQDDGLCNLNACRVPGFVVISVHDKAFKDIPELDSCSTGR